MKKKPIHTIRIGAVKAAIWENETKTGLMLNVTFTRSYKDGEQWKNSESFGRDDLLSLAKCADLAHTWILENTRKEEN